MEGKVFFHSECDFTLANESEVIHWLMQSASNENKLIGEINYIFCKDDYLLEKNLTYLNHDTLTDIITFDYSENNSLSADIYISVERVKENALIFAVPFEEEIKRVIIHGLLHLVGYKDKTEKEGKEMREKENYYLSNFS
jgi:probable rRNA maturation factor